MWYVLSWETLKTENQVGAGDGSVAIGGGWVPVCSIHNVGLGRYHWEK